MSRTIRENQRIQLLEQTIRDLERKIAEKDLAIEAQAFEIEELKAMAMTKPAKKKKAENGG